MHNIHENPIYLTGFSSSVQVFFYITAMIIQDRDVSVIPNLFTVSKVLLQPLGITKTHLDPFMWNLCNRLVALL